MKILALILLFYGQIHASEKIKNGLFKGGVLLGLTKAGESQGRSRDPGGRRANKSPS